MTNMLDLDIYDKLSERQKNFYKIYNKVLKLFHICDIM